MTKFFFFGVGDFVIQLCGRVVKSMRVNGAGFESEEGRKFSDYECEIICFEIIRKPFRGTE